MRPARSLHPSEVSMQRTPTTRFVAARFTESRIRRRGRRALRTRRLPVGLVYGRRFRNRRASASTDDDPPAWAVRPPTPLPGKADHKWSTTSGRDHCSRPLFPGPHGGKYSKSVRRWTPQRWHRPCNKAQHAHARRRRTLGRPTRARHQPVTLHTGRRHRGAPDEAPLCPAPAPRPVPFRSSPRQPHSAPSASSPATSHADTTGGDARIGARP